MMARLGIPLSLVLAGSGCGTVILDDDPSAGGASATYGPATGSTTGSTASSAGSGDGGGGNGGCVTRWTRIVGGASSNWLKSQAVGPDGAIAVTVDNQGALTFDGAPLGLEDGGSVLLKLDRDGNLAWARRFAGSNQGPSLPVAFDSAGNILVGGVTYGEIDIGNGLSAEPGGAAGFVAKWSASGEPMWLQAWSVPIESGGIAGMTLDGGDNVYFSGGIGYDEGSVVQWGPLSTPGHIFVGKILADGTPAWLRGYRGVNLELDGLATTPSGHVVMAASLQGEGSFDGFTPSTPGDFDAFVLDIDPYGAVADARQFGDDALQRASGVAIGPDGSRAVMGITWGAIDFGGGAVTAPNEHRVFIAGFDAAGQNTWAKTAPEAYTPRVLSAPESGGFAFAGGADLAAAWGCGGNDTDGIVFATLDARGACTSTEPIARCGDAPDCAIVVNGVAAAHSQVVVSGYFYGDLQVWNDIHVYSTAWDGLITAHSPCGAP